MRDRFRMRTCLVAASALLLLPPAANAQARAQPSAATAAPEIALQVGGRKYQASGQGECKSAAQAAIYGVRAAMYSVSHSGEGRSLNFNLWRPQDGAADMISLTLSEGKQRHQVDTVKAGSKKETRGSGKATLAQSGAGATFTLDAVTASGEKVTGTIKCPRFAGIRAEGG
jgi:hypothetical protein